MLRMRNYISRLADEPYVHFSALTTPFGLKSCRFTVPKSLWSLYLPVFFVQQDAYPITATAR